MNENDYFLIEAGIEDECAQCRQARSHFPSENALLNWHNSNHQPPLGVDTGESEEVAEDGQASGFSFAASPVVGEGCAGLGPDRYGSDRPCDNRRAPGDALCSSCREIRNEESEQLKALEKSRTQTRGGSVDKMSDNNPFGYGPFVSDDPLVSDQYSHENPANNVGPYSGPSSYSINTTGPYAPPATDEENPGQNVGPYDPPALQNARMQQAFSPNVRAAYRSWSNQNEWFDGTSRSVYDRITEASVMLRQAKIEKDVETEYAISEQINTLSKVAAELDESNLNDYLEALPGGTVAMEYDDLSDAGLVDFGSFISVESHRLFAEAKNYDWNKFASKGAAEWINEKIIDNPGLLRHETETRKAAVDYVKNKTMVLTDPVKRAGVIDDFVNEVERNRRTAIKLIETRKQKSSAKDKQEKDALMLKAKASLEEEQYGLTVPLDPDFVDGKLNIGANDGSLLYTAAVESMENQVQDWPTFTTEGAREWFWSQASDNEVMLNHQDITRRAARDFVINKTAHVRDSALKNEVVRAFCDSVEFLRTAYVHKKSKLAAVEVEDTAYQEFEEAFGGEDQILWQRSKLQ